MACEKITVLGLQSYKKKRCKIMKQTDGFREKFFYVIVNIVIMITIMLFGIVIETALAIIGVVVALGINRYPKWAGWVLFRKMLSEEGPFTHSPREAFPGLFSSRDSKTVERPL